MRGGRPAGVSSGKTPEQRPRGSRERVLRKCLPDLGFAARKGRRGRASIAPGREAGSRERFSASTPRAATRRRGRVPAHCRSSSSLIHCGLRCSSLAAHCGSRRIRSPSHAGSLDTASRSQARTRRRSSSRTPSGSHVRMKSRTHLRNENGRSSSSRSVKTHSMSSKRSSSGVSGSASRRRSSSRMKCSPTISSALQAA